MWTHTRKSVRCRVGWRIGPADQPRRTAADLTAWTRLLGLRDDEDLCDADSDTLG